MLMILVAIALPVMSPAGELPKGILLNLDFEHIENGVIPNKTLYPLHVPIGELETKIQQDRSVLLFREGQGLVIPHSSLLDPDGSEWIAIIRTYAITDGIVMSQGDDESGYIIFIDHGALRAAIRINGSLHILQESAASGITDCRNKWITTELRIKPDAAFLSLNRKRAASIKLPAPLIGTNQRITIGEHQPSDPKAPASPNGFTGAISSFKILRQ